ncbi:efflux RND transporter periplasmic adaptor subunit [Planctomyces sp. SH-PL62]|uniref:efflux RND transporter periplasmic adaptor subunit n=1 Tax=Planctomyces sp. SH-PL62 TaxID=1636152 RepID=UPI00078CEE6B|nr:efflux RND transporter periplasmic adaptor subunit [Planctomyces sp. SH-PL62]AMV37403.1 Macrolide export protein MacA [Planctomyces sp. SH-PL62]
MRARRSHAACLPALGLAATVFAAGCDRTTGERTARAELKESPAVVRVSVVKPTRATVSRTSEQPGQIEAVETTPIYAKLGGYVEAVAVDIGDAVKTGQELARLHVPETEADLKQKRAAVREAESERKQCEAAVEVARAGVESAGAKVQEIQSGVRRAEAEAERWRAEFARVEQLANERALTGSLVDETRSKLQAAKAGRDEVKAKVRSAEAALAEAEAFLGKSRSDLDAAVSHIEVARFEAERAEAMEGYARILSPYDGVVTRRGVDVGHLTTPGAAGEPLFVVARSGVVTVVVGVPETEAPFVDVGDRARVRLQALEGRTFEGRVTRIAWALDPATRTLRTEVDLTNAGGLIRPGLYAYATIIAEEHEDVLSVPASAVASEGGKSFCVTLEEGRARRKEVKLGLSDGKRTEVVSGIGEGDEVVESNSASLADGQAVARIDPPSATPKGKN